MTTPGERVKNVRALLAKDGFSTRAVELAYQHAEDWTSVRGVANTGERGGSSSPTEIDEAQARRAVDRLALRALTEIPLLARELEDAATRLYDLTQRLATTLDLSKLPKVEQRDDECQSCRRSEQKGRERIGDHFAPVYDRTPKQGLCRWCRDSSTRDDLGNLIWPPVEACHIMHTQSARAASMWLDKNRSRAA